MKSRNLFVKIVTGILFGLLILSFAVWGIGDIFHGGGQARIVAKVGEIEIEQYRFSQDLNRQISALSQNFGTRLDMEQARSLGVVQQVLSQSINRTLFDQQASDFRMMVTDDTVKAQLLENRQFRNQFGDFDPAQFRRALQISNMSEAAYLDSLRRDLQRQQLLGAVTEAVTAPQALSEALHAYLNETRVADYLVIPAPALSTIAEPGASDLQAHYDANAARFMAPEYRALSLVQLRPQDVAGETAISDETLRAEFETRRADFSEPEQRSIEQIVFSNAETAEAASQRLSAGEDFAAVAQELTGKAPIPLGMVSATGLLPELSDPAFALEQDVPSTPVKGPVGWHILRATEIIAAREPSFEDIRDELREDLAMSQAVDSMISIANQFDDELAGGADLDEAAASLGLEVRRLDAVDSNGRDKSDETIADLPNLAEFIPVMLETGIGDTSLLTETSDGGYFILRVDSVEDAAPRPLTEVSDEVATSWRQAEADKQAAAQADALLQELVRTGDLAALAESQGLEIMTTAPVTRFENDPAKSPSPQLASQLFQLDVGDTTSLPGDAGYIIAELKEIIAADLAAQQAELQRTRSGLIQSMQNDLLEQYLSALRQEYGVTVNNAVLDEVLTSY